MTSRERVIIAIKRKQPDRVPYCEMGIDRSIAQRIMGWGESTSQAANLEANTYNVNEAKAIASFLKLDNISYVLRAPVYAHKIPGKDGRLFYGEGMIKDESDLQKIKLPDPNDNSLYTEAENFTKNKDDYCCWFVTRIGIFPTMLSIGMENFAVSLFENRKFVEKVLDIYCEWSLAVLEHISKYEFDVYVSTDDMAFKTAPIFSPKIFRELVLPRYKRIADKVNLPWVIHSDGNLLPFLDDLIDLGISGLHPIEKGAMDIRYIKKRYGEHICLLGNVDLNILGAGTPQEVKNEVRSLIRDVAPGGGYIITSGNSLAGYLKPENVLALSEAVQEYGQYPINLM
ncbi:MAG: uroporphyrinogen decarboxylase family protein [bacterium]